MACHQYATLPRVNSSKMLLRNLYNSLNKLINSKNKKKVKIAQKILVHKQSLPSQYQKIYHKQINPYAAHLGVWDWSDIVFSITSKGRIAFQSSPPVVPAFFRVLAIGLIQ